MPEAEITALLNVAWRYPPFCFPYSLFIRISWQVKWHLWLRARIRDSYSSSIPVYSLDHQYRKEKMLENVNHKTHQVVKDIQVLFVWILTFCNGRGKENWSRIFLLFTYIVLSCNSFFFLSVSSFYFIFILTS